MTPSLLFVIGQAKRRHSEAEEQDVGKEQQEMAAIFRLFSARKQTSTLHTDKGF
ncbi:hypothetical protein [Pokkaliibacter plantistimulans]|uniref:hypothetical protein n=1 Tax=Pokkaliibacter plantistimulans TaxID=1635171 RepID=UPI001FAE8748|nr:hypothetical protein [Pokkaliibacter plantistimulans]